MSTCQLSGPSEKPPRLRGRFFVFRCPYLSRMKLDPGATSLDPPWVFSSPVACRGFRWQYDAPMARRKSSLIDTRIIYCGDCIEQLPKLPEKCVDLIYIDPPFNSNRNYEVFWGETKEKRAFEDRHASTEPTSNTCGPDA